MARAWNWWRLSSFGFGLGAVAVAVPLAWTGWLLLRQIKTAQDSDIFAVMIEKGAGGTPGITDSSVSILALTVTVAVFSCLSVVLAEYARRFVPDPTRKRVQPRSDNRIIFGAEDWIRRVWTTGIAVSFLLSFIPFCLLTGSILMALGLSLVLSLAFLSSESGITRLGRLMCVGTSVFVGTLKGAFDETVTFEIPGIFLLALSPVAIAWALRNQVSPE